MLEPRPGPYRPGANGAQQASFKETRLKHRKAAGKWVGSAGSSAGFRVPWDPDAGWVAPLLPCLSPGGGAGSHSRPPCRPLQSRCAVQVRKRERRVRTAARPAERGPRWGSSGARAAAPPRSCRITGISLSVLKQIDPSEQKTLANLPWIVEPGQEAKRGINTKYETTIF